MITYFYVLYFFSSVKSTVESRVNLSEHFFHVFQDVIIVVHCKKTCGVAVIGVSCRFLIRQLAKTNSAFTSGPQDFLISLQKMGTSTSNLPANSAIFSFLCPQASAFMSPTSLKYLYGLTYECIKVKSEYANNRKTWIRASENCQTSARSSIIAINCSPQGNKA